VRTREKKPNAVLVFAGAPAARGFLPFFFLFLAMRALFFLCKHMGLEAVSV
jgi:hypothetical protein